MTDPGAHGPSPTPPPPAPDEWPALEPLLDTLLDAEPHARAALIVELSGGDPVRQRELARLVAECERDYPLLDQPAAARFDSVFGDEAVVLPWTIAGRYQLLREVGRGGMAIVYLARDLRHARDVAVKLVRPELAAALGRSRFLREVGIAARLRHPHIVPLYDSGEEPAPPPATGERSATAPLLYYVMPYEAGHSLRERLAAGDVLPLRDAVRIIRDICEALAHAHQHGIVHRDIKPENVLLSGGHALITDFGVAHALNEATAEGAPGLAGMVVGTPAYMAPEQASNDPDVDHRADIYALGVLGCELLARAQPSAGGAGSQPAALSRVLAKCMVPTPALRWQSAGELLAALDAVADGSGGPEAGRPRPTPRVIVAGVAAGAAVLLAATAVALTSRSRERGPAQAAIVLGDARQLTSEPGLEVQPSISPDGQHVAYAAGYTLETRIAVRPVAGGRATELAPDVAGNQWLPRWSPDGTRVLFLTRDGVFSVPATGGPAQMMVEGRPGAIVKSAAWSPDGREIAYVRGDSLLVRQAGAGRDRLVATGSDLHSCTWSPDGSRLACVAGNAYYVTLGTAAGEGPMFANHAPSRIVLVPAAGGVAADVTDAGSLHQSPVWSPDGRMLYYVSSRHGPRDVYAIDVDEPGVEPRRITTGMGVQSIDFSADAGRIVYSVYSSTANVWAMRIGNGAPGAAAGAVPITSGNQTVEGVRVSPDGRWVIYDSDLSGNSDIYRVPVSGGEAERMTHDARDEYRGAMSPDGSELVYHSYQGGSRTVFLMHLASKEVRQLTRSGVHRSMANWSPDGTALALFDIALAKVYVMRRDRRGQWEGPRFIGGRGLRPEWSPDGRTIAFVSPTEGGIRVMPLDSGTPRDVYRPDRDDPRAELAIYSPDGRHLYFKSHDATGRASFWSIPVAGGAPRLLARLDGPGRESSRFEFASDGKRFYFTFENRQSDVWVAEAQGR